MEKVPMTSAGFAALGEELKKRQSEDRPRIIEHIAEARSHGDLSENAEYHAEVIGTFSIFSLVLRSCAPEREWAPNLDSSVFPGLGT